jgi:hypothetical protein
LFNLLVQPCVGSIIILPFGNNIPGITALCSTSMPVVESVLDIDVTGDVSNEGLTFAFDDDEPVEGDSFTPPENDQERLAYMEDVFDGSTDIVSPWKRLPYSTGRIEVNGAESRLLDSMKRSIKPLLTSSSRLVHKNVDSMNPADFASIYLNTDWYLLVLHYINSRIDNPDEKTTPKEIFEMHRLWMLQCIYGETAMNLLHPGSRLEWDI